MFATDKVGDTMTVAMRPEDGEGVVRRRRRRTCPSRRACAAATGCTTTCSASTATTRRRPAGTTSCSRTSACRTCCGSCRARNKLVEAEYEDHEKALGAAIAVRGLAAIEPAADHKYVVRTVAQDTPGLMSRSEYEAFAADLVNYLDYMAEPSRNERMQHRHRGAAVPRRAVRLRLLDQGGVLEGRAVAAAPSAALPRREAHHHDDPLFGHDRPVSASAAASCCTRRAWTSRSSTSTSTTSPRTSR